MVVKIPYNLFSHHRRIAYLYKKWLRQLEGIYRSRIEYLYHAAFARAEFDVIYNEKDMIKSKRMLMDKEEELHTKYFLPPIYFVDQPGGCAYDRSPLINDHYLDYWHPLEKAIYPEYFARREVRKQQYIQMWEKQYGPPKPEDH